MQKIANKTYSTERSLYGLEEAEIDRCSFKDSEIAESPLKECKSIDVLNCLFALRYPLWHVTDSTISNCEFKETSRAALWYDNNLLIKECVLNGVKALRECNNVILTDSTCNSLEFGWKCNKIRIVNSSLVSEYPFFMCDDLSIDGLTMKGKYSFQYNNNLTVKNSKLDTKDAFWHVDGALIENCEIVGEYIGWYSKNLTFKNCKIKGTQPFCYCENLILENCELIDADLAFEYSDVKANLTGKLVSVKNPKSGYINVPSIDELILKDSKVENNCKITTK